MKTFLRTVEVELLEPVSEHCCRVTAHLSTRNCLLSPLIVTDYFIGNSILTDFNFPVKLKSEKLLATSEDNSNSENMHKQEKPHSCTTIFGNVSVCKMPRPAK